MSFLLDEHTLKTYIENVVYFPADADPLKKYKDEMAKEKKLIVDGVKDHVIYHIVRRGNAKEMWDALSMLYQGYFKQHNMYLEKNLRST